MLVIIGAVVVVGSVAGGFVFEGGHLLVLNQPAEFIIIGGAAIGSLIISTPPALLKQIVSQLGGLFRASDGKPEYLQLLGMQFQLFRLIQQSGVMSLEAHFENPPESSILSQYPKFLARPQMVDFLADSVKVVIMGGITAHDLDELMEGDIEVQHEEELKPAGTVTQLGDAMPGLGIVAAVLGVVITMGVIDGPAEEIGHKVGAALVGTFLGILASYGFLGPLATNMTHRVTAESYYTQCLRAGLLAVYKGLPPAIAVEFARRVIPFDLRPTFEETEQHCKTSGKAAGEATEAPQAA
jgi:chemotaxis protein MotA